MITGKQKAVVASLLLALGDAAFASANGWQRFSSSAGFSVLYPGTWVRNGVSTDRLVIHSSKGGAEAIGIKQGQAEITAMEAPESSKQTLAHVIAYYTQDTKVLSDKDVPGERGPHGCRNLREVTSKEATIPSEDSPIRVPNISLTDLFCEADGRKIVTVQRNWEGDKKQEEYQQVALRIIKAIRFSRQNDASDERWASGSPKPKEHSQAVRRGLLLTSGLSITSVQSARKTPAASHWLDRDTSSPFCLF